MKRPQTKAQLLETITTNRRQLERYLFYFARQADGEFAADPTQPKISQTDMTRPGVIDDWAVQDFLLDIARGETGLRDWLRGEAAELQYQPRSEVPTHTHLLPSAEDTLPTFIRSYEETVAAVTAMPEEKLFSLAEVSWGAPGATIAEIIVSYTALQYAWAKDQIRQWQKEQKPKTNRPEDKTTILAQIKTERRKLEETLAGLTLEEMERPGVNGDWAVKDVLGHLLEWEQMFLGWYAAGLRGETPELPAPGLNWSAKSLSILNQRIFATHRHRPAADILLDFHASYEKTLKAIEGMTEEEIFRGGYYGWLREKEMLAGYIRANTYKHYEFGRRLIRRWLKGKS